MNHRRLVVAAASALVASAPLLIDSPLGCTVAAPLRFPPDGTAIIFGVSSNEQTSLASTILIQDIETGETLVVMEGG